MSCEKCRKLKVLIAEEEKKRVTVIELYGTAELLIGEKDKRMEELKEANHAIFKGAGDARDSCTSMKLARDHNLEVCRILKAKLKAIEQELSDAHVTIDNMRKPNA